MRRFVVPTLGLVLLLFISRDARGQTAGEALETVLFGGALSTDSLDVVRGLLRQESATFPIGSSSGGFAWTFDPTIGVARRRSQSFGPMFAERPFTTGKGKMNLGVAFQRTTFESVAGEPLSDLRYVFQGSGFSDVYRSDLKASSSQTVITFGYGITDRIDLGIVVPFGRTSVSGTGRATFTDKGVTIFDDILNSSGTSTGVGDVVVRAKYALPSAVGMDMAVGGDIRLPTGDSENLLGVGTTQVKPMFMVSYTRGMVTPHVNIGYTFGGKGFREVPDPQFQGSTLLEADTSPEVNYTFGADVVVSPKVTIAGDVVGRSLRRSASLVVVRDSFGQYFNVELGTVNLLLGVIGAKVNIGGSWLIAGSVLFPLNSNGVKPGITPVIGFERAF